MAERQKSYQGMLLDRGARDFVKFAKSNTVASVVAFAASIPIIFVASPLIKGFNASDELVSQALTSLLGPLFVSILAFLYFYLRAGSQIYREQAARIEQQDLRLTSKLQLSLPNGKAICTIHEGTTTETIGGTRQTNLRQYALVIRISCKNLSENRISGCRATILNIVGLGPDGEEEDLFFRESVTLPWSKDRNELEVTLEPNVTAPIYVLGTRRMGSLFIYRNDSDLPVEYHQIVFKPRAYRMMVQVVADGHVSTTMTFDVQADSETGEIKLEVRPDSLGDPLQSETAGDVYRPSPPSPYGIRIPNRFSKMLPETSG